jgi:predicted nucleic-acid-binding Zn-ribbon protein
MEQKIQVCPKCGGQMEEGFIIDYTHGAPTVSSWVQGPPQKGWLGGAKSWGKERREVRTFRCVGCGFLESYATEWA